MNIWKLLAILFLAFSISAIRETIHIFTSTTDQQVISNRAQLIPIALACTALFLYLAFRFWRRSLEHDKKLK